MGVNQIGNHLQNAATSPVKKKGTVRPCDKGNTRSIRHRSYVFRWRFILASCILLVATMNLWLTHNFVIERSASSSKISLPLFLSTFHGDQQSRNVPLSVSNNMRRMLRQEDRRQKSFDEKNIISIIEGKSDYDESTRNNIDELTRNYVNAFQKIEELKKNYDFAVKKEIALYESKRNAASPQMKFLSSVASMRKEEKILSSLNTIDLSNVTTKTTNIIVSSKEEEENKNNGFVRYDNVAIVTKVHGPHQWKLLVQSMCLFHHAYNHKVLYDVIIFTTVPIPVDDVESLRTMLHPVKVRVVVDNEGLQNKISALSPVSRDAFLKRCNVTAPESLTWFSSCGRDHNTTKIDRLAYSWQAEFRSIHLWHHPSLAKYKYMLWLDADAFCSKPWEKDPVAYFIENNGVVMFDHFPHSKSFVRIQPRLFDSFNSTICKIKLSREGNLVPKLGGHRNCLKRTVPSIHGFFHITNMDFYRSPPVKKGLETLYGNCFLCSFPDDQLAVTAPAAILAPEKAWDMRSKGFKLDVVHNFLLDGMEKTERPGFVKYWNEVAKRNLTSDHGMRKCPVTERD